MIRWFANNPVAANLLMLSIFVAGWLSWSQRMVIEFFPSVTVDTVAVRVPYRGATPAEVEESVVVRIEEAVQDLEGIDTIRSTAAENIGTVLVEVESGYEPRELLDDIKNRVDAISTFPEETERPVFTISKRTREAISVIVASPGDEATLRDLGERVKEDLLALGGITQIEVGAVRNPEIAIELDEEALLRHGITLVEVSRAIANTSRDLPAGSIESESGEILIRTLGQVYDRRGFEEIVVRNQGSALVKVKDLGTVIDGYEEDALFAEFNGKRCVIIEVTRVGDQSALEISDKVKNYVNTVAPSLGDDVEIQYWRDRGKVIRSRLQTLTNSAWQGGLLVLTLLTLFLRPTLAFWVCLGIPVSFMGALIFMPTVGVSINIISLFGFILVLGIVVDDAIVTGENIFRHIRRGDDPKVAAVEGTLEVSVPVTFGVLTTAVAFFPLLILGGGARGDIFAQLPAVILPVLAFSLIESKLILPSHLRRLKPTDPNTSNPFSRLQMSFMMGLEKVVERMYRPVLRWCLRYRISALVIFFGFSTLVFAYAISGRVGFQPFPRVASETPFANLQMPLGTPFEVTARHLDHIRNRVHELQDKYRDPDTGESVIRNILTIYGATRVEESGQSHLGRVRFEMVPPEERLVDVGALELMREWRQSIGEIPGAEGLVIRGEIGRSSDPIDIQLAHTDFDLLQEAADAVKAHLSTYAGVFDIADTFESGKQEVQITLKPLATTLGVDASDIASQVRNAFFGAEAQRIQRGRDDIRIMVRYPAEKRQNLEHLNNMRILLADGRQIPLREVAQLQMGQSFSSIQRMDRKRTLNITGDIDKKAVDQSTVMVSLRENVPGIVHAVDGRIAISMEGEAKESRELGDSLKTGVLIVLFLVYALLAIPFKSYGQPFIVMSIIPFGLVGAILGHAILGVSGSFPSIFGVLALIGVVVNDSLVMVDYINRHRREAPLMVGVFRAGMARFRPIVLTSLTTFFGLMPLLLEQSTQSQFLKPMAISLGFGILFATVITLLVVPVVYVIYTETVQWIASLLGLKRRENP